MSLPSTSEFQAIVLCGPGSNLYPLIADDVVSFSQHPSKPEEDNNEGEETEEDREDGGKEGDEVKGKVTPGRTNAGAAPAPGPPTAGGLNHLPVPKALLPVGNKPMLDWVLAWIEQSAQVSDALIIANESQNRTLSSFLHSRRSTSHLKTNLECMPDSESRRSGTAGALRWAKSKGLIKTDFILLSCDTLFLPFSATTTTASSSSHQPPSLAGLLDLHRENSNLLTTLWYERSSALSSNIDEAKDDPSGPNAVGGGAAGGAAGGSGVGGKGKQAGGKGKGGKGGKDDKDKAGKKKESEEDQVDDDEYAPPLLVTLDPQTSTLLDFKELEDFEDEILLRKSLLKRYPSPALTTSILPAHVYVFSKSSLAVFDGFPRLKSVSEEVVPLLAKAQWQRGLLRQRAAQDADLSPIFRSQSSIHSDPISRSSASSTASTIPTINPTSSQNPHRPSNLPNSHSFISASGTAVSDSMGDSGFLPPPPTSVSSAGRPPLRTLPSENSPGSLVQRHGNAMRGDPNQKLGGGGDAKLVSLEGSDDTKRIGKTSIVVWKKKDGFCARGNTVEGYRQMNRAALKVLTSKAESQAPPLGISTDSILGQHIALGERLTVKSSSIGKNCSLGKFVKIEGSVLGEAVSVGEGAKLENCIVCARARIGDRAELKNCEVGEGVIVEAGSKATNEKLADLGESGAGGAELVM